MTNIDDTIRTLTDQVKELREAYDSLSDPALPGLYKELKFSFDFVQKERDDLKRELAYQVAVNQNYAEGNLEAENQIDALQQDVALLSSDGDTYCSKYNTLLEQHRQLTHSYSILSHCYFSQVSGDGWEL